MFDRVKIFADGADVPTIQMLQGNPLIAGFTTNPTLMRKAGVKEYEAWAKRVLEIEPVKPFSFEVLSEEEGTMIQQARKIAAWGDNVYVKIPAVTSTGRNNLGVVLCLAAEGIRVNVTALMSSLQATPFIEELSSISVRGYISIFAGRIADTGRDPVPHIRDALEIIYALGSSLEVIWASPRQLLDVVTANVLGCHIITVTPDILKKIGLIGKPLDEYSRETALMFATDAEQAGYIL
jgi:transaldolase